MELDKNFFGRTEILDLLRKRVVDLKEGCRQNVALLGNRHVGKSAILQYFLANLAEEKVTAIYLELDNKDFDYFFRKFVGSLLYNYSKSRQIPLHDNLNFLIESTQNHIPHTVAVIKKIQKDFEHGKLSAAFLGLLMLPEVFTNETGQFCVLVLDEFQNLEGFGVPHAFQNLGKKIMTQKKCFYIMSSSERTTAQKILSEKLSLLFGNFETVDVDTFDNGTSAAFVKYSLRSVRVGDPLCQFLADFTGGHPLYLNLISREMRNLSAILKQKEVFQPLMSQAVENTLFDKWGVISRHFELAINELASGKANRSIAFLLLAIADGKIKADHIVMETGIKKSQALQKLGKLVDLGVIIKNGNLYYYKDKLFKYWVKYVYRKRLKGVELAPDRQRQEFREEFNAGVEDFHVTTRQDFSSRIIDLFYCFDNEAIDLNGRKYKLPTFREIRPCRFKCENGRFVDVIMASTGEAVWYIVSKSRHVEECDVNAILQQVKGMDSRLGKCLIVSLEDLDENARLKALQEKFWIWSEQELNTLLTLFNKPYIVQ